MRKIKVDLNTAFGQETGGDCKHSLEGDCAVFVLRRFTKKFRSKGKKLFYVFVDLEKAFNLVPQKVTWWVLRIKGDPENLVHGIMSL